MDRQQRIEAANALNGKRVRFHSEKAEGHQGYLVQSVTPDGLLALEKFAGLFAPHLFAIVDPTQPKPGPTFRILASSRQPGVCKSCGARITWALTYPGGKLMPLTGNPIATSSDDVDGDAIETIPSSASHFASCPQSQQWSRRK